MDMEYLVMNYSDEEDVFPSEDGAESNHFTSRTPKLADDAMQEDMEILNTSVVRTFGFPGARSPCDFKGAPGNNNESSIKQIEDDDNIEVVSDEGDWKDVTPSIIISNVESTRQSLTHHMMMTHKIKFKEGNYLSTEAQQLESCDFYSYPTKYHHPSQSLMNKQEKAKQLYTCKFCSYTTEYEDYFESHLFLHTETSVWQEADLETSIDLDKKCENYSVLSARSEREDEEGDKENSAVTTLPISFSSLVGQEANTVTGIDLDSSKSHTVSLLKVEEDEGSNKEATAAANFPISSSFLVEQEVDLETSIDLDRCEKRSIYSPKSEREDEESGEENSTAATLSISLSSLVGQEANAPAAIDLNNCKNHNVALIKSEEVEQIDKGNSTAIISPISSFRLVGLDADMGTVMDLDNTESRSESPLTDKQDTKSEKQNSFAVVRNPVNSLDQSSESQGEKSRQFLANGCDISTNLQKYQDKPVISDRTTFKRKRYSYSSTIRFGLKRHMLSHFENSDLNKIKCQLCPFEAKSKKSLSNHWLVTHKIEKSKCTICDTFVPAHLKEKHVLNCKTKKNVFECKECQYKTMYERIFVRHHIDCSNKRHSISRKSEASGDQCGKSEKNNKIKFKDASSPEEGQQLKSCNFCSYTTKYGCSLKKHLQLHTVRNEPNFSCTKCDYKAPRVTLGHHYSNVHGPHMNKIGQSKPVYTRPVSFIPTLPKPNTI